MSKAQRYAHAGMKDGITEDTLVSLASLATWGQNPNNAERDFHRWMPYAYNSHLESHYTVIDVLSPDTGRTAPTKIPVLLTSDVLSALWTTGGQAVWDGCIGRSPVSTRTQNTYLGSLEKNLASVPTAVCGHVSPRDSEPLRAPIETPQSS